MTKSMEFLSWLEKEAEKGRPPNDPSFVKAPNQWWPLFQPTHAHTHACTCDHPTAEIVTERHCEYISHYHIDPGQFAGDCLRQKCGFRLGSVHSPDHFPSPICSRRPKFVNGFIVIALRDWETQ